MNAAFVRAAALASSLGPDLESALGRLRGEPLAPQHGTSAGGLWPYFPIPLDERNWKKRAETIAFAAADSLRREAALSPAEWAVLPCLVGSSSYSVGAWDEGGEPALQRPLDFCSMLARRFGVRGPIMMVNTACTSGLSALDLALGLIAAGRYRNALVIGVELANRLTVAGFAGLELLSSSRARPCDRARDGLVLGEALSAVLVSAESGRWRIASLASGIDAASLTGPGTSGRCILDTMRAALTRAHWTGNSVDLLKLQAGGAPLADLAEARAIRELFAAAPQSVSLKGALGHTLGASGPAELALLLGSLDRGRVPDTWGFATPDEELGLAPSGGDAAGVTRVLFNLSGFGGSVMSLALERAQPR